MTLKPLLAHFRRKMAQLCLWTKICVGFSMYECGFSVPQMRQFCFFAYPPSSKWASSEKMIFFLLKSASSVSRSQAHLVKRIQAYIQPYSFGGRIKLIMCQILHELSVTIHEISTNWNKTLNGGPYTGQKKGRCNAI